MAAEASEVVRRPFGPDVFPRRSASSRPSRFGRVVDERHRLRHGMMAGDLSDGCMRDTPDGTPRDLRAVPACGSFAGVELHQ